MKLEIAVVLGRGQVRALTVRNNLAFSGIDRPMRVSRRVPVLLLRFVLLLRKFGLCGGAVVALPPPPAGQILAVEERRETLRRLRARLGVRRANRHDGGEKSQGRS